MSVSLDFKQHPDQPVVRPESHLLATQLRYDFLLGAISIDISGVDLSPEWNDIPVLDFAVSARHVVRDLATSDSQILDFTDNEQEIHFARQQSDLEIHATYRGGLTASCSYEQFSVAVDSLLNRVAHEVAQSYPAVARSAPFIDLIRSVDG